MNNHLHTVVSLLACSILAGCSDAPKYELAVNWEAGKRYRFSIEFEKDLEVTNKQLNQSMKQLEIDRQEFVFEVEDGAPGGGKVLTWYLVKLEGEVHQSGKRIDHYSTDSDSSLASIFLNKKVTYHIDADGNLERIEGLDQLVAGLKATSSAEMHEMIDAMFGENAMAERYTSTFVRSLPTSEVGIGETWKYRSEVEQGQLGVMVTDLKYTLDRIERHNGHRDALIDIEGSIEPKDGKLDVLGMGMSFDDTSGNGRLIFDLNGQMISKHYTSQNFVVTMTISEQGKSYAVKSKTISKQTMTLLDVETNRTTVQ